MSKKYEILQTFKGSPDGITVIEYSKGTDDVELSDALAEVALAEKWAKLSKTAEKEAKAKAKADAEAQAKAEAERVAAEEQAKAETERIAAEEQAKAERVAAIEAEIAKLEAEGAAALEADPTGATAAPIKEQWQAKQNELAALLQ